MRAEGLLFMSRTRPIAGPAADGTFQITLLAMDRMRPNQVEPWPNQVEPWRITWAGEEAREFWSTCQTALTPGQPLRVVAQNLQGFSARHIAPEIHAHAISIQLAPRSTETHQHRQATEA